jgi:hypothetical protein
MPITAVNVGPSKESIEEARVTILEILKLGRSEQVCIEALKALATLCQVNNTSFTNCTITCNAEDPKGKSR